MLLLGIDLETTGLKVEEDRIIEIGAVMWDTERDKPLAFYNSFVDPRGVEVSDEITEITGITKGDILNYGILPDDAISEVRLLAEQCEAIVAHNGTNFDMPLLKAECARCSIPFPVMHWIDTSLDVPYPARMKTRSLVHLAAEHGFINPFPHRALSDVLTMLKVLSYYDANEVLRISKEPNVKLIAVVKEPWKDAAIQGKKESDKAKARGFRFNGEKKTWEKLVKESALQAEQSHGEFDVKIARD